MTTQDVIVTVIALGTIALLVARWWRRRARQEPGCASCDSNTVKRATPDSASSNQLGKEVKPVAFFGSSGRGRGANNE